MDLSLYQPAAVVKWRNRWTRHACGEEIRLKSKEEEEEEEGS